MFEEATDGNGGGGCGGDKPVIFDWEAGLRGLLLGVFHIVDVLWDARIGVPEVHHLFDERDDVRGIKASAAQGDLIEELAESHFVEVGDCVLEREDPGLLDDCLEEEASETLDGFDEFMMFKLGRVESLGFHSNGVGVIGGVEGVAEFGGVLGVIVQ